MIRTIGFHLAALARAGADLLLPELCRACQSDRPDSQGLCSQCLGELLTLVGKSYCARCGAAGQASSGDKGCPLCPEILPRFERIVRLGPYEPPLKPLIRNFKYRQAEGIARQLGTLLATAVRAQCPQESFDMVMPIPMHWRRRLWRRHDHARSLSAAIARELRLPVGNELVRLRHTPPQAHLSKTRRLQNVRGAFGVGSGRAVAGAKILLVDDVTTTGATANEAARALLSAGASRVVLAVVAKAQPPLAYAHVKE